MLKLAAVLLGGKKLLGKMGLVTPLGGIATGYVVGRVDEEGRVVEGVVDVAEGAVDVAGDVATVAIPVLGEIPKWILWIVIGLLGINLITDRGRGRRR